MYRNSRGYRSESWNGLNIAKFPVNYTSHSTLTNVQLKDETQQARAKEMYEEKGQLNRLVGETISFSYFECTSKRMQVEKDSLT